MASDGASGSRSVAPPETDDVIAPMRELGLQEEDLDDVVYNEKETPLEASRWMALVRVHSPKSYIQY